MRRNLIVVAIMVFAVSLSTFAQNSACPGLKDPLNFTINANYSGATGSRPDGTSTYQQQYMVMNANYNNVQMPTVVSSNSNNSYCQAGNNEANRFVIKSAGNDPHTNNQLPYLPPGGNFIKSIRLGNCYGGAEAEALYYTMQVTPQNALIFINYAIVLYDARHDTYANPEFIIRVKRQTSPGVFSNITDTLCYIVQSPINNGPLGVWLDAGDAVYKPWAQAAINLNNYLYETVRIEMYVGDCSYSAHYGYCYIAGDCQPMQLTGGGCAAGASTEVTRIHAPKGLDSYQWQRKNLAGAWENILGATDSVLAVQSTDFPIDPYTGVQASENDFKCVMTSCLDPTKPITSYLQTTVKNKKPYIAIDDTSMCDGTIIVTDRSQCFSVEDPTDAVDTTLSVWNFGDGSPLQYGGTASHRYAEAGDYNITLTTYAANQTCYAEGERTVTARRRPPLNIATTDTAICRGERLRFMSGTDIELRNYHWKVIDYATGDVMAEYPNDVEMMHTFRDTSIVELRAENMEGCDTIVQKMIYVEDFPNLLVDGDTIVCNGSEAVVNVDADIANCTFGWYLDTTLTSPFQTGSQLRRSPTQDETYYVKVTTPNGCEAWGSFGIHLMVPRMTSNKTKICADESVILTGSDAVYYEWTSNPHDPSLEGQEDSSRIEVWPKETTTYTMVGKGQNGCRSTPLTKTVTVYPFPIPEIDYSPSFVDSEDPFVTFTDISEGSTWTEWNFHDGNKSTERSVTYEFKDLTADSVYITMRTANDLGCESDTTIAMSVSVFSVWLPNAFTPDKSDNNIFRSYTGNDIRDYSLYIYDRAGNQLFYTDNKESGWDGTFEGRKCKQGVYVWVVHYRRIETDKVIQQKGTLTLIR